MIKRYKIILSVLLVILTAFTVVTVTGVVDINKMVEDMTNKDNGEIPQNSYDAVFTTYASAGLPLLSTDIDNVFYAMDTFGNVSFYRAGAGEIVKLTETGTFDVEVTCSGQELPATIHYLEEDGKTVGYGLFTNIDHPEVYLYEYAFFKVTNQFDAYDSKSDLLLLIDVDKARFYSEDKVYSESFYLYSSHKTDTFLNEDQRIVDLTAKLKTDYKMFTDDILHQDESRILFFSSRFYNDYSYSENTDIFISGGSGENVDNNRYIIDVASLNFWRTEDGVRYFAEKTDEAEDGTEGFVLMNYASDEKEEIREFSGSVKDDYIIDGEYMLSISSGEIYNVVNGKTNTLDYSQFKTTFIPDIFDISENGKYCVVRGKNNIKKPSLGVMDFESGSFYTFTDNAFGYVAGAQALNDGTVIVSLATGENSSTYYQLVLSCKNLTSSDNSASVEATENEIVG